MLSRWKSLRMPPGRSGSPQSRFLTPPAASFASSSFASNPISNRPAATAAAAPINYDRPYRPTRGELDRTPARLANTPDRYTQHRQNGQDFTDSRFLADRIKLLCSRALYDDAVDLVKVSHATNVVVWNVLLHEILLDRKYKRCFELWMDMKRRGITPSVRSYTTFFNGHSRVKEIEGASLARVKTVFAQWELFAQQEMDRLEAQRQGASKKMLSQQQRIERGTRGQRSYEEETEEDRARKTDPSSLEPISCIPTNAYLHFLSSTKNIDLLLTTFSSMPATGLLAPDSTTYSTVLSALRSSADPEHFQVAMKLWKHILAGDKAMAVDTTTVSVIISICREAVRPDDQKVGLDVAQQFYGLVSPTQEDTLVSPTIAAPRVALDSAALSNIFSLALKMQQYNLVTRWFDQVRNYPKRFGAKTVLESWHCDLVYLALAAKKDATAAQDLIQYQRASPLSSALQPTISSYTNAIQVCWRSADLVRAFKILELMTGKRLGGDGTLMEVAMPIPTVSGLPLPSKSLNKTFLPDERIISTILQTALATRNRSDISRTIELAEAHGFDKVFYQKFILPSTASRPDSTVSSSSSSSAPASSSSHNQFWRYKLSEILEKSIDRLLQTSLTTGESPMPAARRRELSIWRGEIVRWLESQEATNQKPFYGQDGEETMKGRREMVKDREQKRKAAFDSKMKAEKGEREFADESSADGIDRNEERSSRSASSSSTEGWIKANGNSSDHRYGSSSSSSFSAPQKISYNARSPTSNDRYTFNLPSSLDDAGDLSSSSSSARAAAPSSEELLRMERMRTAPVEDWPTRSAPTHVSNSASPSAYFGTDRETRQGQEHRATRGGGGARSSYSQKQQFLSKDLDRLSSYAKPSWEDRKASSENGRSMLRSEDDDARYTRRAGMVAQARDGDGDGDGRRVRDRFGSDERGSGRRDDRRSGGEYGRGGDGGREKERQGGYSRR